jgi:hypothetical protein
MVLTEDPNAVFNCARHLGIGSGYPALGSRVAARGRVTPAPMKRLRTIRPSTRASVRRDGLQHARSRADWLPRRFSCHPKPRPQPQAKLRPAISATHAQAVKSRQIKVSQAKSSLENFRTSSRRHPCASTGSGDFQVADHPKRAAPRPQSKSQLIVPNRA